MYIHAFYFIVGVLIGNAIAIGLIVVDHLLWLRYFRKDDNRRTYIGYGFYLAIKYQKKRAADKAICCADRS